MRPLVAFDLDGTLVDSQRDLAESANAMLEGYGARPLAVDEVASMVGEGASRLVARALRAARADVDLSEALRRFLEIYAERLVLHTRPYPGIPEALEWAEGKASLALLTNKPEGLSRSLLDALNLARFFPRLVGGDSVYPRKPDPAGLNHLMASSGTTPERTLLVGDSMVDVETARRAGAGICVARYGFGGLARPIELEGGELVAEHSHEMAVRLAEFIERQAPRS